MPTKPSKRVIDACKKTIDPKQAVLTLIDSDPGLRQAAIDAKIVREVGGQPVQQFEKE